LRHGVVKVCEQWRPARFRYDGGLHLISSFLSRCASLDEDRPTL
jgi:hypothetical protein